jgi:dTDP-glucose 4,6-dehydratase
VKIGEDSTEDAAYNSNSPYAASKAGGEELCVSYSNAFDLPVSILHMTNTFGPMCQPNRYPVILIRKLLNNEAIDIHVGENNSIGGRRWFYAGDVADQTRFILTTQTSKCEKWNSAGDRFINNFDLAKHVAEFLGKELICNFILIDRPGHDLCFSITPSKIYNAGWTEKISTLDRLKETVDWYKANQSWLTF